MGYCLCKTDLPCLPGQTDLLYDAASVHWPRFPSLAQQPSLQKARRGAVVHMPSVPAIMCIAESAASHGYALGAGACFWACLYLIKQDGSLLAYWIFSLFSRFYPQEVSAKIRTLCVESVCGVGPISHLAFSSQGLLAIGCRGVDIWDFSSETVPDDSRVAFGGAYMAALAFSPDGRHIAVG